MKRTELRRKTPLRTRIPLHSQSLLRGSGLNRVSRKRAKENRERTEVLRPLRAVQPWCARCGVTGVGLDAHEIVRRSQASGVITNAALIRLICRRCHSWIGDNPQAAHDEGWVIWSWEHREAAS